MPPWAEKPGADCTEAMVNVMSDRYLVRAVTLFAIAKK